MPPPRLTPEQLHLVHLACAVRNAVADTGSREAAMALHALLDAIDVDGVDLGTRLMLEPLRAEMERQASVYPRRRTAHPNAIHGLPITPVRELRRLQGASFCISFFCPRQLEEAINLLGPDSILLLDNGAFSAWRAGATFGPDYWLRFYNWSLPILERVPQSLAVIPDIIGGSEAENWDLIEDAVFMLPFATNRVMPVWHLHESYEQLDRIVSAGFSHIAFGSSGELATIGTPDWNRRVEGAFELIEQVIDREAYARPRIHMMRGLGLLATGRFPFATADSTNLARNHARSRKAGVDIEAFRRRIEQHQFPAGPGALWPRNSYEPPEAVERPLPALQNNLPLSFGPVNAVRQG